MRNEKVMNWALVTGASSGIGLRYARALARDYHYNIVLVSNQEKELEEAAKDIQEAYGVDTRTIYANLAEMNAAERVFTFCEQEKLSVEVLVNNAGILIFDAFDHASVGKIETLLMLHVVTLTKLCRLFGGQVKYILNMSSMSAWMAVPTIQVYNASKSYVYAFSKALWYEYRLKGVHVLTATPGSTDTGLLPFPPTFGKILKAFGITMSPEKLVNRVLKVLFTRPRRKRCMPGAWNYIIVPVISHLPDWLIFSVMKKVPFFR